MSRTNDVAKAIDILNGIKYGTACLMPNMPEDGENAIDIAIKAVEQSQSEVLYIISETLRECGIYGEEATIKLIGTLKRIGRDDLITPCAR